MKNIRRIWLDALTRLNRNDEIRIAPVSTFEFEDHIHRGFNFDRLLVQQIWAISPSLDGINRCLLQHRRHR